METTPQIQISQVEVYGALRYSVEQMATLLRVNPEILRHEMENPDSEVSKAYSSGRSKADYNADTELLKKAQAGDAESITLLEQREQSRKLENLKSDLFGL